MCDIVELTVVCLIWYDHGLMYALYASLLISLGYLSEDALLIAGILTICSLIISFLV